MEEKKVRKIEVTLNEDGTSNVKMNGTLKEVATMIGLSVETLCEHHRIDPGAFLKDLHLNLDLWELNKKGSESNE